MALMLLDHLPPGARSILKTFYAGRVNLTAIWFTWAQGGVCAPALAAI